MHLSVREGGWPGIAAGALVLLFILESFTASRAKSPIVDEPYHIAGAISYIAKREIRINPQHPPLLKELSGLSLRLAGVGWPEGEIPDAAWNGREDIATVAGAMAIVQNGVAKSMFWARLPLILISSLLGVLLFLWGRRLAGPAAAVGAVFLFALDPTYLAHSYLVTTDCGLATFTVLFLFALWRYLHAPGWGRLGICGLTLGLALASKFSGVVLIPIAGVLLAASAWFRPEGVSPALPWFLHPYGPPPAKLPGKRLVSQPAPGPPRGAAILDALIGVAGAVAAMCLIVFLVMQVVYLFPADPLAYLAGMRKINADHKPDYLMYMAGQLKHHFSTYYLVAFLVKAPLALIALTAAGLWFVRRLPALNRIFLLVPGAALFAGYSVLSDNIGVRYVIPVLPFVYLLGGIALAGLWERRSAVTRAVACGLCLWMASASAGIYPDHLSYFNEAACAPYNIRWSGWDGGTRCGPFWLDDSNVDWGQSLPQLKQWLDIHAPGERINLSMLGLFPPSAYGIRFKLLQEDQLLPDPEPGLYAVSSHLVASLPPVAASQPPGRRAEWLRRQPDAIVGHAFYIFRIR